MQAVDPFGRTDSANLRSWKETGKVFVVFLLLGIPKLLAVVLLLSLYALFARLLALLSGCSVDDIQRAEHPHARRAFGAVGRFVARSVLRAAGHRVRVVKGAPAAGVRVFACTHVAMADVLVLWGHAGVVPGFVSKVGMLGTPVLGTLLRASRGVVVRRSTPGEGTAQQIARQVNDPAEPPMAIFPEGTTTNGTALIRFHRGAFVAGAPVQPVALRYPHRRFNPAYDVMDWPEYVWRLLGQLRVDVEVEFLPVHAPTAEERADPQRFADAVRAELAHALGVPVTEHTYKDKLAAMHASDDKYD